MYKINQILSSDGRGKVEVFGVQVVLNPNNRINHLFLDDLTNEQVSLILTVVEETTPSTPEVEKQLKDVHKILCERLNWKPEKLSHIEIIKV